MFQWRNWEPETHKIFRDVRWWLIFDSSGDLDSKLKHLNFWHDTGSPFNSRTATKMAANLLQKSLLSQKFHFYPSNPQGWGIYCQPLAKLKLWNSQANVSPFREAIHQPQLQKWSSGGGNCWPEVFQITSECVCLPHAWNTVVRPGCPKILVHLPSRLRCSKVCVCTGLKTARR